MGPLSQWGKPETKKIYLTLSSFTNVMVIYFICFSWCLILHCANSTVGLRDNFSATKSNVYLVKFNNKNVNLIQTANKFVQPSHATNCA